MKYVLVFLISTCSLSWNLECCNFRDSIKQERIKYEAFQVLQIKCNVCHATKKKTEIFTFQNMDSLANNIDRQVFIKRKMPKGRKFNLTVDEEQLLKGWIVSVRN